MKKVIFASLIILCIGIIFEILLFAFSSYDLSNNIVFNSSYDRPNGYFSESGLNTIIAYILRFSRCYLHSNI